MRMRLLVWAAVGALAGVTVATGAHAGPLPTPNVAYWVGQNLYYSAGVARTNFLVVTTVGSYVTVFDDTSAVLTGAGCSQPSSIDPTVVICVQPEGTTGNLHTYISLDDGNDTVEIRGQLYYNEITAGTGDDTVRLLANSSYYNIVYGNAGNDTMTRAESNGVDRLIGGTGADQMCSANGVVSYEDHGGPVTADIGGVAGGDGSAGEGDTICASVGGLVGTLYNDTLSAGSSLRASLSGRDGNDRLVGGSGRDFIWGEGGADTLVGNGGDDYLNGGIGADGLNGGAGIDECHIGPSDISVVDCNSTESDPTF